jgi:hypothetical protein
MAKKKFFKRAQEAKFRKLLEIASHGEDCVCKDKDCIQLRGHLKEWREKMQPFHDAIEESTRITAADLAIIINTRA